MFKKGNSGNPKGRPQGAINKNTKELREMVSNFLLNNFEQVVKDFKKLQPKERTRLYCDLLQYGLPRLQNVSMDLEFEQMTDQQLNKIIDELKQSANENTKTKD